MNATISIVTLWLAGLLPIKTGLYRADGRAWDVRVRVGTPGSLEIGDPFSLERVIAADPDYTSAIDVTVKRELNNGSGYLVCGEGSHGSEGFFGRLDIHGELVWVVYLEDGNPFIDAIEESLAATFTANSGSEIHIDLENPLFGR